VRAIVGGWSIARLRTVDPVGSATVRGEVTVAAARADPEGLDPEQWRAVVELVLDELRTATDTRPDPAAGSGDVVDQAEEGRLVHDEGG
jgi:hypothetical protein